MFIKLILKAKSLDKYKLELIREKETAWTESQQENVKLSLKQKYRRRCIKISRALRRCCILPKKSCLYKPCFNLRYHGTYENYIAKSIAGFLGGFCLTYIFFMFFVLQLNFKLSTAMIMCSIFGSILTIGLAFSYNVRCIVFLVLPQFFSKKGRQALLAYAYILAITGPAKNTLNNMSILGESLACGQEQLKEAVRQIIAAVKKPFYAIRDAIKAVIKAVKVIVIKIKEILLTIKRIIVSLLKMIKSAFAFIARIMNMCNKELGTPFERCQRVFEDAITDCNAKLGPFFNWLCNITYLVKSVCYIAKILDFVCIVLDFIKDTVTAIITKVKQFVRHMRTMFYVRIKFSHSYHFESNHSKSMADITTGIVTEIKQRSSGLIKIFDFMNCAASIFFLFMIVKVIYYRQRFLTNEQFDNKFITKDFRQIDIKRAQRGLETVLPLNHRERQQYITTSSLRLVKKEKSQLSKSAMVLLMATLKLSIHMATDYSLYWIMTLIRFYGRFQSKVKAKNIPEMHIVGEGFLANLLRGIVKAFRPIGISLEIDTVPCLPDPIPPDYDRYVQIASLLILCWFLAIFEPYGLRLRHSVMCYYHPHRARERSIWLYNNIMRSRSSFLKFARRQLRRKVMKDKSITKVTFMEFLRAKLHCRIFRFFLGSKKQEACLLCGEVFRESEKKNYIRCQTPNCPGLYCEACYADLQNLCTVCLDPIQYGDLSDISEEKDSSEEEDKMLKSKKIKKKKKKSPKSKSYDTDTDTDEEDDDNDKRKLLKKNKNKDSDYYSTEETTGFTTDYSYSYQDNKDVTQLSELHSKQPFKDTEKQNIPEYASMEVFRKQPDIDQNDITNITTADEFLNSSSSVISEIGAFRMEQMQSDQTSLGHLYATNDSEIIPESKLSMLNKPGAIKIELDQRVGEYYSGNIPGPEKQNSFGQFHSGNIPRPEEQTSLGQLYFENNAVTIPIPKEPVEDFGNSSSSVVSEVYASKTIQESGQTSLGHLYAANDSVVIPGSKLSILNTPVDTSPDTLATPKTPSFPPSALSSGISEYSEFEQNISDNIIINSKRSSESILIGTTTTDVTPYDSTPITDEPYSQTDTSLILTPPLHELNLDTNASIQLSSDDMNDGYDVITEDTSVITELKNVDQQRVHPDVPQLDLKYLQTKSYYKPCGCITTRSYNTSCNCRFYKESVKYLSITETTRSKQGPVTSSESTDRSSESKMNVFEHSSNDSKEQESPGINPPHSNGSSSLISSLFNVQVYKKVIAENALLPLAEGESLTHSYDEVDTTTSWSVDNYDQRIQQSDIIIRNIPQSSTASYDTDVNVIASRRGHKKKDDKAKYNQKVRNYYRNLNMDAASVVRPLPKDKSHPFKKMFDLLKGLKRT